MTEIHRVLERFTQTAAIPASHDENVLDIAVSEHRNMHKHLMIDVIVPLGDLDCVVERHHLSEHGRFENLDFLKLRLLFQQAIRNGDALGESGKEPFLKPLHC